tara:strand:+ start:147 stop:386 length:240 start_codon:yes stop_codon:yes gene_type:complete
LISFILGEFGPYIAGALALMATLFGVYRKGGKDANTKHKAKVAKGALDRKDIRDEIDDDVRVVDAADELRRNWTSPKPR